MLKYMTGGWGGGLIEPVEIDRESDSSVFIGKRRHAKRSSYQNYFDTWEDAHAFLIEKAEYNVAAARRQLEIANGKLGNIRGLKRPE